MDQHFNNSQNDFLWALLANPANDAHLHAYNLQRLVNDFPQSGILQALLAHASDEKNLRQASVYFNPKSLYKLINAPSTFVGVPDEKIIIENNSLSRGHYRQPAQHEETETLVSNHEEDAEGVRYFNEQSLVESEAETKGDEVFHHQQPNEPEADFSVQNHVAGERQANEAVVEMPVYNTAEGVIENETAETVVIPTPQEPELTHVTVIENTEPGIPVEHEFTETRDSVSPVDVPAPQEPESIHEPVIENKGYHETSDNRAGDTEEFVSPSDTIEVPGQQPEKNISDDTPDEIAGIGDFGIAPENHQYVTASREEVSVRDEITHPSVENEDAKENRMPENSPKADFFMFNRATGENTMTAEEEGHTRDLGGGSATAVAEGNAVTNDAEHQDVSKYHDEKMPYTFMWWLDKTRREHAGKYQPYIKPEVPDPNNKSKKPTDELQQQYFENIFHITSVEELDKSTAPLAASLDPKRKEHVIIERFIKEEPQIRPQSSDKLDNENKAKKSSEDRDELVTETLAAIYTDQMLYHKAIASYKKLMLKFPEKSRYFVAKIEQLEKKTN
ncbi:MAG: hypothetical protein ACHQIM_16010 [Sphingobacteriales bacterium]